MALSLRSCRGPLLTALVLALLASLPRPVAAQDKPVGAAPVAAAPKLDLNAATEAQLILLPKVGPATAKRILEYRKQVGTIRSVDELLNVKGIGEKTLEILRPLVMVAPSGPAPGSRS